jgi:cysteine synthase A
MQGILDDILAAVGNTPVIRLNRLAPAHCNVFVKSEAFNPMGSVKDRLALGIIEDAERRARSARADGDRSDQRQHRHRPGHGLRGQGLPAGGGDGRELQHRAAQADALPRREGGADAAALRGMGANAKAEELVAKHGWFHCRSSTTKPTPTCIRAPPRRKSSRPSRTGAWTGS